MTPMSRRRDSSARRRSRSSADDQLDHMLRRSSTTRPTESGSGGSLLAGLLPAPAGGLALSTESLGIRSVRVQRQRETGQDGTRSVRGEGLNRDGEFLTTVAEGGTRADPVSRDVNAAAEETGPLQEARSSVDGGVAARAESYVHSAAVGAIEPMSSAGAPRSFAPGDFTGSVLVEGSGKSENGPVGMSREPEVPVNAFWSPERKAYERLHAYYGDSGGVMGQGTPSDTPNRDPVELDPINLFRIRCFREAEEKFRAGLMRMAHDPSSSGSYFSVVEENLREESPKPPPGPPPKTPPREEGIRSQVSPPPPPPPLPPIPPMPWFGGNDGSGGNGEGLAGVKPVSLGENPNESLRTFDLPRLEDSATALEFGDWLSMVDSYMGDLSYSSGVWWKMIRSAVDRCYQEWLQLGPLDRLRVKPQLESQAHLWPRTERRALAMLLQAVPEHLRAEVISARKLSTDQVMFRLFCTFQPGGASERTRLLQAISDCKCGESVKDALTWIRVWRRHVGRALELGVTLPDALVLVGVLQGCSELISNRSPQVAYRLNMMRQQLGIDQQPTTSSVMTYSEHLQAEGEELVLTGLGTEFDGSKPPRKAVLKAIDGVGKDTPKGSPDGAKGNGKGDLATPPGIGGNTGGSGSPGVCRYWGSQDGCKRGDRCKFGHSMLNPKDNRCFGCSAVGHSKRECPHLKKKVAKGRLSDSKGDDGSRVRKDEQREPPKEPPPPKTVGASGEGGQSSGTSSEKGDQLGSFMQEAAALMKSLQPKVKMIRMCKADSGEFRTGLLDGGATNPLRKATADEIASAVEVQVELAAGTVKLFQSVETGVLLSPEEVEPIVPLRGLIALGYKIRWDERGCLIFHPQRGRIRCWLRNGCPVVTEAHALGLIGDIEAHERFKRLGPKLASGKISDGEREWWTQRFPDVPPSVVDFMAGQDRPPKDGSQLPWNRRKRRQFQRAKGIIVHLFAGNKSSCKEWEKGWPPGIEVVTVDLLADSAMNLHHPDVWGYLCHLVKTSTVFAIIGGPPCRTVSRLREIRPGPPPLRGRDLAERFGLGNLDRNSQLKTDGDSALVLKQIALYEIAKETQEPSPQQVGFLMESPRDPAEYTQAKNAPTFWNWPEVCKLLEEMGMQFSTFDQGCLGHPQIKPTSCLSNLPLIGDLHGRSCDRNHGEALLPDLEDRVRQTASWSSWAPGLKQLIRASLLTLLKDYGYDDGTLKKVWNRDQWLQHFRQGHRPFRRDCRTCVLDMGTGKPHRRRSAAGESSWAVGLDIVQFPKSVDEVSGEAARYAMIATMLVPVFDDGKPREDPKKVGESEGESWGEGLGDEELSLEPPKNEGLGDEELSLEPPKNEGLGDEELSLETPKHENQGKEKEVGDERLEESGNEHAEDEEKRRKEEEEELLECSTPLKVQHVTVAHVMSSRATPEVIHGLNSILTQYKTMGLPVHRIHSDKARELVSRQVRKWATERLIQQTTTGGDDASSAGHVESEVNQVKRRMRLLLRQAQLEHSSWPIALRYAVEDRRRVQLERLGTPCFPMIPFFSSVLVKRKRWHDRGHLAPPFVQGTLLGPSHLMHHGWTVRTVDNQIVHVREAVVPSSVADQVSLELQETKSDEPQQCFQECDVPPVPPYRLHGKQGFPGQPPPFRVHLPDKSLSPAAVAGGEEVGIVGRVEAELNEIFEAHGIGADSEEENVSVDPKNPNEDGNPLSGRVLVGKSSGSRNPEGIEDPEDDDLGEKGSRVCMKNLEKSVEGRWVSVERLESTLLWEHAVISKVLEDTLNQVPIGDNEGACYGKEIHGLTMRRSELEQLLEDTWRCQNPTERLCAMTLEEGGLNEVLQTTVISLEEVKRNLGDWKAAMEKEYHSLTVETQAIEAVNVRDLNETEIEYVPGKLVCTLKAGPNGGRKKCRGVICGNLVDETVDPTPWGSYASGADGLLVRATLKHGVQKGWGITTTDVKTAFLLAPRPKPEGAREVIVVPPKIMVMAGVCKPEERWKVHRALYGFPSSPARWSMHRDGVLQSFVWEQGESKFDLQHTPEGNLWKIFEGSGDSRVCVGHVLIYVDDVLVIAPQRVREGFMSRLKQEWSTSEPETVTDQEWIRFCGLELRWEDDRRLCLAQPSYTKDLLERHGTVRTRNCPMPKVETPTEAEPDMTKDEIKAAQMITGELLWLSVKSRPDITFAVSLMSRFLSKNPKWVKNLGNCVLEYLAATPTRGLIYEPCGLDRGPLNNLPIARHEELIEAYADISFAPQGGRSCQGIVLFYAGSPIQWEASRQPFCAMSTAEAELLGYCESMQVVQALEALLVVLHGTDNFEKLLCGDNSSAISILTKPDGPWRTRHLRLRSHGLKEKLASTKGDWKLRHQRGTELIADFLTKPITSYAEWQRFAVFMSMAAKNPDQGEGTEPPPAYSEVIASSSTEGNSKVIPLDETKVTEDCARLAKLSMVIAAVRRATLEASGSCRELLSSMAAVLVAIWTFLGAQLSRVGEVLNPRESTSVHSREFDVHDVGRREENKSIKAMRHKKQKKARGDEPASPRKGEEGTSREDEPGVSLRLREWNEPSGGSKVDMAEVAELSGWLDRGRLADEAFDGRRAGEFSDVEVQRPEFCEESDPIEGRTNVYYCPSGCPRDGSAVGSSENAMDEAAERREVVGTVKLAAMRSTGDVAGVDIWEESRYQSPPNHRKDSWIDVSMNRGWLIRAHGSERVRNFHPLHRGTPVPVDDLLGTRVTVAFDNEGNRVVVRDRWTLELGNVFTPKKLWRGWTFFELRTPMRPAYGARFWEPTPLPDQGDRVDRSDGFGESQPSVGIQVGESGQEGRDLAREGSLSLGNEVGGERGYRRGGADDRGRLVTSQLPLGRSVPRHSGPLEDPLSDESEWERISTCSLVD